MYRGTKYHSTPVVIEGRRFPSKGEGERYLFLKDLEFSGKIQNLRTQVRFVLSPPEYTTKIGSRGKPVKDKTIFGGVSYIADFVYQVKQPDGTFKEVVEDFKGMETQVFKIKEQWLYRAHGIRLVKTKRPTEPVQ